MSKLTFIRLFAKNFRSIDNSGLEIVYEKDGTTLVGSDENGAGKSTLTLYALYYGLFDKPYKSKDNKTSLINSRNNKDCLVEIEFEINGSNYVVRRGMKPTVFDIIKDGTRVEDEAALKDYQSYLLSIIGHNEKTASNSYLLGKDKFVSFTTMGVAERRAFGEGLLDLGIVTTMNEVAKEDLKEQQKLYKEVEIKIGNLESDRFTKTTLINSIEKQLSENFAMLESIIEAKNDEKINLTSRYDKTVSMVDNLKNENLKIADELVDYNKLLQGVVITQSKISDINKEIEFYRHLDSCDKCKQTISSERKKEIIQNLEIDIVKYNTMLEKANEKLALLEPKNTLYLQNKLKIAEYQLDTNIIFESIKSLVLEIDSLRNKQQAVDLNELNRYVEEKKFIESQLVEYNDKLDCIQQEITTLTELLLILKDDGIKASVVENYIPYLNQQIDYYLRAMNIFVQIELDSEFNVNLISPDRKNQTISSLSSGQERRIDLAILLAWLDVANLKSSVDTNIIVMDEILESLSERGVQDFMNMWEMRGDTRNLFVISQRVQEFREYFKNVIIYSLKDDFTIILED